MVIVMKKALAMILAGMLMFSLCACQYTHDEQEKAPVPSSAVSVSYDTQSGELSGEDDEVMCIYEITTPVVTLKSDKASEKISARLNEFQSAYREGADAIRSAALAQMDETSSDAPYEYNCSVSVARGDTAVLSLIYDIYTYSGGTHGYTSRTARCFDIQSGDELTLEDITEDVETLKEFLYGYVLNLAAGEKYTFEGESIFFEDFNAALTELIDGDNWYFANDGLVIFADPYSIASFVQGRIDFVVPYDVLSGLINDKYIPAELEGENGMILAEAGSKDDTPLKVVGSVELEENGSSILLSAEDTVYRVTVSTADGKEVFYRNYLTTGQAIQLLSVIPEDAPSLILNYTLSDGTVITRGIFRGDGENSIMLVEIEE